MVSKLTDKKYLCNNCEKTSRFLIRKSFSINNNFVQQKVFIVQCRSCGWKWWIIK